MSSWFVSLRARVTGCSKRRPPCGLGRVQPSWRCTAGPPPNCAALAPHQSRRPALQSVGGSGCIAGLFPPRPHGGRLCSPSWARCFCPRPAAPSGQACFRSLRPLQGGAGCRPAALLLVYGGSAVIGGSRPGYPRRDTPDQLRAACIPGHRAVMPAVRAFPARPCAQPVDNSYNRILVCICVLFFAQHACATRPPDYRRPVYYT